jgi:hypothetical protein
MRAPSQISAHNFCSSSCAVVFNNTQKWGLPKPKIVLSKEEKRAVRIAGSRLGGINSWKNYKSKYTKEYIVTAIQTFVNVNNRLPVKKEMMRLYSRARERFGTWNKAIQAAGYNPNPVMFANKQVANDGHICDSMAEKIIDDWFYARNIPHQIDIKYPGGKFSADFVVEGIVIEFFGLRGELSRYDQLMKEKLRVLEDNDVKFIAIYPKDLFPNLKLNKVLKRFIKDRQ